MRGGNQVRGRTTTSPRLLREDQKRPSVIESKASTYPLFGEKNRSRKKRTIRDREVHPRKKGESFAGEAAEGGTTWVPKTAGFSSHEWRRRFPEDQI